MIRRAGELIADVDRFLTRLATAHDDLVAAASVTRDGRKVDWAPARLDGALESRDDVAKHQHGTVRVLESACADYEKAVDDVRKARSAKDLTDATAVLAASYRATRKAAHDVRDAAQRSHAHWELFKWLSNTGTTLAIALAGAYYSYQLTESTARRDDEDKQARVVSENHACNETDWAASGPIARAADVTCTVWTQPAWRSGNYELKAAAQGGKVQRTRMIWGAGLSRPPDSDVDPPATPAAELSLFACDVTEGTPLRLAVWATAQRPGGVSVTATWGENTPCALR